jgi:hypothetical protein
VGKCRGGKGTIEGKPCPSPKDRKMAVFADPEIGKPDHALPSSRTLWLRYLNFMPTGNRTYTQIRALETLDILYLMMNVMAVI